jgi:hypothetical protein
MSRGVLRLLGFVAGLAILGCGGGDDAGGGADKNKPVSLGDGGNTRKCKDADHDKFGDYCDLGDDCDDSDPLITDECIRCASKNDNLWEGCPCEPGTESMKCTPKDKKVIKDGVSYTVSCTEGRRYCRDALYTDCEFLEQYTTTVRDN